MKRSLKVFEALKTISGQNLWYLVTMGLVVGVGLLFPSIANWGVICLSVFQVVLALAILTQVVQADQSTIFGVIRRGLFISVYLVISPYILQSVGVTAFPTALYSVSFLALHAAIIAALLVGVKSALEEIDE